MTDPATRDWLTGLIRNAHRPDCGACRSGAHTCPQCAAGAVVDACRAEELFIVPKAEGDQLVEFTRQEGREEVQRMVGAEADRLDTESPPLVSAAWVADRLRHIARHGCPGPHITGKTCVHERED